MVQLLQDPKTWIAFLSLTVMEIVLGIDNIVLISLLVGHLPEHRRSFAGKTGLILAMIARVLMLLGIVFALGFAKPLFTVPGLGTDPESGLPRGAMSLKDLLLIGGGLFLLGKASNDIHDNLESGSLEQPHRSSHRLAPVLAQIFLLNTVFSIDSVLTAVGMADHVEVMIAAVLAATALMFLYAKHVAHFIRGHPTMKMLALAFIVLIAVNLIGEGFHYTLPKGYTYFAMAFAVLVELLNSKMRSRRRQLQASAGLAGHG